MFTCFEKSFAQFGLYEKSTIGFLAFLTCCAIGTGPDTKRLPAEGVIYKCVYTSIFIVQYKQLDKLRSPDL